MTGIFLGDVLVQGTVCFKKNMCYIHGNTEIRSAI